jgi:hypothetical protein
MSVVWRSNGAAAEHAFSCVRMFGEQVLRAAAGVGASTFRCIRGVFSILLNAFLRVVRRCCRVDTVWVNMFTRLMVTVVG